MSNKALTLIVTHPLVQLCFLWPQERWAFARYFSVAQEQSVGLLSMRETIERYRCSSLREIAEVMDLCR